jgi:hypothetical protein
VPGCRLKLQSLADEDLVLTSSPPSQDVAEAIRAHLEEKEDSVPGSRSANDPSNAGVAVRKSARTVLQDLQKSRTISGQSGSREVLDAVLAADLEAGSRTDW